MKTSHRTLKPENGFTLLELLIVIAIIAILASVAFPVTGMVIDQARKAEARNEVMNIVNAIKTYETEYSKYPVDSNAAGTDFYEDRTDREFMGILLGDDEVMNPRRKVFYEGKNAKEGVAGLDYGDGEGGGGGDGGGTTPRLVDPWGEEYYFQIDADYDGKVGGPTECEETNDIRQGVIAWSKGKPKEGGGEFPPCRKWPKSWE